MSCYENIRFLRKKKGWTQEKFSKKIGIKRSLVGAYEEGRSDPRLSNLLKMCEVFSISLDNILKKDVSALPEAQYLKNEDQNVKVLSITVDKIGKENIKKSVISCNLTISVFLFLFLEFLSHRDV